MTLDDIRAACVAAGLPGATIIMARDGSIIARDSFESAKLTTGEFNEP